LILMATVRQTMDKARPHGLRMTRWVTAQGRAYPLHRNFLIVGTTVAGLATAGFLVAAALSALR
jgi:hypothetical protein